MASKGKKKASTGEKKPRKKPVDDGIPKNDKATVTRFCRDILKDEQFARPDLSVHKVKKAIMESKLAPAIMKQGSLIWRMNGFTSELEALLDSIPATSRRKRMSPEERAKFEKQKRDAILETAKDGPVNVHSLAALKVAYLQGLKEDERAAARTKFEKATAEVLV